MSQQPTQQPTQPHSGAGPSGYKSTDALPNTSYPEGGLNPVSTNYAGTSFNAQQQQQQQPGYPPSSKYPEVASSGSVSSSSSSSFSNFSSSSVSSSSSSSSSSYYLPAAGFSQPSSSSFSDSSVSSGVAPTTITTITTTTAPTATTAPVVQPGQPVAIASITVPAGGPEPSGTGISHNVHGTIGGNISSGVVGSTVVHPKVTHTGVAKARAVKPYVCVAGATGKQGGSVIAGLVKEGLYTVRGITRDTNGNEAKALKARFPNVELVQADLSDRKAMVQALDNCQAFFLVTQFWEKSSEKEEVRQGVTAIDAAVECKVPYIVLSTLPGAEVMTGGKIKVPHFDGKWKIADYLRQQSTCRWTFFFMNYYMENLQSTQFGPKPLPNGGLQFEFGMHGKPMALASVEDIGPCVVPLFREPQKWHGKIVDLAGDVLSVPDMVAIFKRVTRRHASDVDLTPDGYFKLNGTSREMADMFAFYQFVNDCRLTKGWTNPYTTLLGMPTDSYVDAKKVLHPDALNFENWLLKTGWMQEQGALPGAFRLKGAYPGSLKQIVAVAGATGQQGGAVVDHLYRDGSFQIRAITRDKTSDKARELATLYPGIEFVDADLSDRKAMASALTGCAGFYLVTQFWEKLDEKDEINQGITAIDAAIEAKVNHLVLSCLPSSDLLTGNKVHVPHFDSKWKIAEHLMKQGNGIWWTLMFIPYYYENFANPQFGPKPDAQGKLQFCFGLNHKPLAMASVADAGAVVLRLFKDPARYDHKLVDVVGDTLTVQQMVDIYQKVTKRQAVAMDMDYNQFSQQPGMSKEIADMFLLAQIIDENRHRKGWSDPYSKALGLNDNMYVSGPRTVYSNTLSFEQWLRVSGWQSDNEPIRSNRKEVPILAEKAADHKAPPVDKAGLSQGGAMQKQFMPADAGAPMPAASGATITTATAAPIRGGGVAVAVTTTTTRPVA